ncbi:MAG: DMT family transporter [Granulosicoccaceae bacterium]
MNAFYRLPDSMRSVIALMFAAFAFSLMAAMVKLAGTRLPVTQILLVRQLVMGIILAPVIAQNFPAIFKTQKLPLHLARILCALVAMLCGFTALIHMPLADATALAFAKSFFVTVFAVLWLGETVGKHRWTAVVAGFVGVLIMLQPGSGGISIYGVYALMAAASAGAVMVIIRLLSRTESSPSILAYQSLGVAAVMIVPAILYWVKPTIIEWLLLLGIGVVSYFGQKANIYAYKYGEASLLASLDYVRLIYATILGWLLFSQWPQISTGVGALVIVMASIYTVHREAKRQQSLARAPDGRGFTNN